jgi:hypothetical protein
MYEVRFLEDQHWLDRARFMVARRYNNDDLEVLRPDGQSVVYTSAPGAATSFEDKDWFTIPLDALVPLHSHLTKKLRLDGLDDGQGLRKDYNAERERVDTLMATVIRIADRASRT